MARRCLFLDVDGVLNIMSDGRSALQPLLLKRLGRLVRETGASLVLSSLWRHYPRRVDTLTDALKAVAGLHESDFIGMTGPNVPPGGVESRAKEIEEWLKTHMENGGNEIGGAIESWCVLDDLPLGAVPFLAGHFVRCNPRVGISDKDVKRAKKILLSRRTRGTSSTSVTQGRNRAGAANDTEEGSKISQSINDYVESLAQEYKGHVEQVKLENQFSERELLLQAKTSIVENVTAEDETVLYDTGTSFLALQPRLVVSMLDAQMSLLEEEFEEDE